MPEMNAFNFKQKVYRYKLYKITEQITLIFLLEIQNFKSEFLRRI